VRRATAAGLAFDPSTLTEPSQAVGVSRCRRSGGAHEFIFTRPLARPTKWFRCLGQCDLDPRASYSCQEFKNAAPVETTKSLCMRQFHRL